jgi:hypothetical protein
MIALIPLNWEEGHEARRRGSGRRKRGRTARRTGPLPGQHGADRRDLASTPRRPRRWLEVAAPRTRAPRWTSHRGLSGTKKRCSSSRAAGRFRREHPAPPVVLFHAVVAQAMDHALSAGQKMPCTMPSWKSEQRPRRSAGASSAM